MVILRIKARSLAYLASSMTLDIVTEGRASGTGYFADTAAHSSARGQGDPRWPEKRLRESIR